MMKTHGSKQCEDELWKIIKIHYLMPRFSCLLAKYNGQWNVSLHILLLFSFLFDLKFSVWPIQSEFPHLISWQLGCQPRSGRGEDRNIFHNFANFNFSILYFIFGPIGQNSSACATSRNIYRSVQEAKYHLPLRQCSYRPTFLLLWRRLQPWRLIETFSWG